MLAVDSITGYLNYYRSSHRRSSLRKAVLKNFTKFTGKHLCQCLFLIKVAGRSPAKKETLVQVFSCELWKVFKNTFLTEHLWTTVSATRYFNYEKQEEFSAYFLGIWLQLLQKSLKKNFIFCSVRLWSRYHNYQVLYSENQKTCWTIHCSSFEDFKWENQGDLEENFICYSFNDPRRHRT